MSDFSFASILNEVTAPDGPAAGNFITDGSATCGYPDIPALLDVIDAHLRQSGVTPDSCPVVDCPNSLSGALLILALFRSSTSFVLVPPAVTADIKPAPEFCDFRITVASPATGEFSPAASYRIEPNAACNGRLRQPGRLYLRTSGSMGTSKIVVHTHAHLFGNAGNVARKYGFSSAARAAIPVPIAHMYGLGAEFLPAFLTGASIDLQDKTNLLKYLDREKRFQPTIVFATPAICEMLRAGYKKPRTHYHVFVTSGQRISNELFRAFDPLIDGKLINQYGSTEMGATAACDPGDDLEQRVASIGSPMNGVELKLERPAGADPASGTELFCKHPFGFEGYENESGDWLLEAGEWYRTGDLAIRQSDGSIVVTGRADASVNRRGYLVLLSDIERIVERLGSLTQVVVVAGKQERLTAFCVPEPGAAVDGASIRERCFAVMPHYAIPDEVRVTDTLPLLPSGKVDRRQLAELIG